MKPGIIRGSVAAPAVMLAALAQAACGTAVTGAGSAPAPRCPARLLAGSTPPAGAPSAPWPGRVSPALIPPGAVTVSICQYAPPLPASKARLAPARRIVLRGTSAAGLAAIVDGGLALTAAARRCDRPRGRLPFRQALVFGYRRGRRVTAAISYTGCSLAIVAAGSRAAVLASPLQSDLFSLASVTRRPEGPPAPGLVSLSIRSAAAAAARGHWSLYVDGAAVIRAARPGTVVFQVPPAGVPDAVPGRVISVVLAARPAPGCVPAQLALSYLGGGAGAGSDFGSVVVRDDSPRPCALAGPLRLAGTDPTGRLVTRTVVFPVAGAALLSPATGPVSQRVTTAGSPQAAARGAFVAILALAAEYRDGPASVDHGYCEPLWITPAGWRVTLPDGQSLTVPNADPFTSARFSRSGGLVTCRGELAGVPPATVAWQPGATG